MSLMLKALLEPIPPLLSFQSMVYIFCNFLFHVLAKYCHKKFAFMIYQIQLQYKAKFSYNIKQNIIQTYSIFLIMGQHT